jgi:phenol hydroxylase P0 protein
MHTTPAFNPERKFIRIMKTHANGLIEFEFAVGEPELFVELLMAQSAFDEFCVMHQVTPTQGPLMPAPDSNSDNEEWDWSLRAAREQQIRHGSNKA